MNHDARGICVSPVPCFGNQLCVRKNVALDWSVILLSMVQHLGTPTLPIVWHFKLYFLVAVIGQLLFSQRSSLCLPLFPLLKPQPESNQMAEKKKFGRTRASNNAEFESNLKLMAAI